MRVLHVLNAATGGAARSSLELIRELHRRGLGGQAIVCHNMGTEEDRKALTEAVEGRILFCDLYWWNRQTGTKAWKKPAVALLQGLKTGWGISSAMKVAEFAIATRSTLVHSNSFTINDGCRVSRWLRIPHVWHLRELIGRDAPFVFPLEGPALGAYVQANSEAVIANSSASAQRLAPYVSADHMRTIPNGINVRDFQPARKRARNVPLAPNVVGMVANLTSRMKNHELFLRAASSIPADDRAEFRIYGYERSNAVSEDSYAKALRALAAQPALRDRVQFMGYVSDPLAIMEGIDILVHPCAVESFGRVVLEAMAAGLPVVSVMGGGVLDMVVDGKTGFLVNQNDPVALARGISELIRNPELRDEMGTAGRERAESEFSLSVTAEKVLGVYEDVCTRPRRPAVPSVKNGDVV